MRERKQPTMDSTARAPSHQGEENDDRLLSVRSVEIELKSMADGSTGEEDKRITCSFTCEKDPFASRERNRTLPRSLPLHSDNTEQAPYGD